MISTVSTGTDIALYADDTKIWRTINCWRDHILLQKDITALYKWSIKNKMRFHPSKCIVLTVTGKNVQYILPFDRYAYHLNNEILEYKQSQKDLGINITSKLLWKFHCMSITTKASSRLGLLRRTLHYTKNKNQKRVFYLSLIRSLFEHCSVIWHPYTAGDIAGFVQVQKRAVKWILSEQYRSYSDSMFLTKQVELDILPMEYKFIYTDLVPFHQIVHKLVDIELPSYICPKPTSSVGSRFKTPFAISSGVDSSNIIIQNDNLQFRSIMAPKVNAFKYGFFYRTHLEWNKLPFEIRKGENLDNFKELLKKHIWKIILAKPD